MYDVNVAKGVNGGFIVTVSSTVTRTQVIKYKITTTIDLYDSLNEMIYSGNPANYTIVINGVSYTSFTTIAQVVDKLELLFNVDAIGRPIAIPDKLEFKIASANVRNTHAALVESVSTVYEKLKTITFMNPLLGVQRFIFTLATSKSTVHAHGILKHNGVVIGVEQTSTDEGAEIVTVEATPTAAGSGYTEGDTLAVIDTNADDATVTVTTTTKGIVSTINAVPPSAGQGYLPGDILTLSTGGANAQVEVATIAATGGIETVTLHTAGTGYEVDDIVTVVQAGGSNGTIQVESVKYGIIATIEAAPTAGGAGYLPGDVLEVDEGADGTVTVGTIAATGGLQTLAIATGGTGFAPGANVLTVVQAGGANGTINCTADAGGIIVSIDSVATIGTGYAVGNGLVVSGGTGADCTVNLTVINGAVATVALTTGGTGYTIGNGKATTGVTGTGCTIEIATVDGLVGEIVTFSYVAVGTGYAVANELAVTGGTGVNAKFNITVISGAVATYNPVLVVAGTGYVIGAKDTTGGNGSGASCEITAVDGVVGAVTVVTLGIHGGNYTTGAGKVTTGGTGAGCTVEISAIGTYDSIFSQDLTNYFLAGDTLELWLKTDGAAVASAKNLQVAYDTIGTDIIYGVNT